LEHKWLKRQAGIGVLVKIVEILKSRHSGAGRNPVRRTFKTYGGLGPGLRRGDEFFDVSFSISSAT
jgi:hypothetical protein